MPNCQNNFRDFKKDCQKTWKKDQKIQTQIDQIHNDKDDCLKEQNKILQDVLTHETSLKLNHYLRAIQHDKKQHLLFVSLVAVVAFAIPLYSAILTDTVVGKEHAITRLDSINSAYVIQNLKGDTIDTWLSWRLVEGTTIHVNLIDAQKYPKKLDLVRNVVYSDKTVEIDDSLLHKGPKGTTSTYYMGWSGALKDATMSATVYYIPQEFEVIGSSGGEGEITIHLTDQKNGDGYSGFTKSIADETQHQILKSQITIYEVSTLSDEKFKTILRHEFGHALGLAHSTAPEDLMYPVINTEYPYISECDVDAITLLYDGTQSSKVTCEK